MSVRARHGPPGGHRALDVGQHLQLMLDHLVYATADVDRTVDDLEQRLGVRPAPGGQHPGRGTPNALVALSDTTYLAIIGPDTGQTGFRTPRWFQIDALTAPRMVAWAARAGISTG